MAVTTTPGAHPFTGMGPRESLPDHLVWPTRRGEPDGPTESQTRTGAFRRIGGGLWVPAEVELTPEQRIVEAAARVRGRGAVTGWGALRWLGATWFQGTGRSGSCPVPVAMDGGHALRPDEQLLLSQEILPPGSIRRAEGLRLTGPLWSVAFEMRKASCAEDAVVAFDMAAFHDLVTIAELSAFVEHHLWIRQGVQQVRDVLPFLEENSWSPMESVMRHVWVVAECPRPLANRPVFDLTGRFVGTPDVFDPWAGVYGQYDGALHLAGSARHGDVVKEAAYRALGLECVTMMAGDLAERSGFIARLQQAYARAGRRPAEERRWLVEPPEWWTPTWTVEQRRALSPYERTRYLSYRHVA